MSVAIRRAENGPVLTREPVLEADLSEALSEFHRDHVLRKGRPEIALNQIIARLVPLREEAGGARCVGYRLELREDGLPRAESEFGVQSLAWVAQRGVDRLRHQKILGDDQEFRYELVVEPADADPVLRCPVQTRPIAYLRVPLRPLLLDAQPHQTVPEGAFHVFYTRAARERAELFARKGALDPRRVETGGVLVGFLCSCPDTGDFFGVVTEVFEVMEAEQSAFTLEYTSRSWTRVFQLVKARQAVQPAVRLLGQCHGHNFIPNGGKTCEPCRQRPFCSLTNLFVSIEDQNWSRAVFCRQPWQLCHIFGLSARSDQMDALHTLLGGRLTARGYFVLPSFDPARWESREGNDQEHHGQAETK